MRSKTKYKLDESTLKRLYKAAGFPGAENIRPLGAGEFNAVFVADAGGKEVVIKIAPGPGAPILDYEKGMMESELYWYGQLSENTDIRVPKIYYKDMSKTLLPTGFFVMERLPGQTLNDIKPKQEERALADAEIARIAAKMHKIKGEAFGYRQQKLHSDWYSAIRGMTQSMIDDAGRRGKSSRSGKRLLTYIDKYKDILLRVPCRMVNFDLWDLNFLCTRRSGGGLNLALIDPERCFWGDPVADFVCLDLMKPLREKTASIAAYNEIADIKIDLTYEEEIRYCVALAYLGVLMETEKYYRYSLVRWGWWRNVLAAKLLFSRAFKFLGGERPRA